MQTQPNFYIASLAGADIMMGVIVFVRGFSYIEVSVRGFSYIEVSVRSFSYIEVSVRSFVLHKG